MDGSWWLFCLLWSVLLTGAAYVLLPIHAPDSCGDNVNDSDDDDNDEKKQRNKKVDDRHDAWPSDGDRTNSDDPIVVEEISTTIAHPLTSDDHPDLDPTPLTLVDLPPEVHCEILSFLDRRGAVGYVGAARALRVLGHRQAMALRPTVAIGECMCGCDMHICDRCSCGQRADGINLTIYMGCSTMCYSVHITKLLAAGRVDDARALCRRLEGLVLPAFAHLGDTGARQALTSWLLYDVVTGCGLSARVDAGGAALAHEMAGTCVFRQEVWESGQVLGIDGAIERGHYTCTQECLTAEEINERPVHFWDPLGCISVNTIMERAANAGDDPVALDRLALLCRGAQHFDPTTLADGAAWGRRITKWNRSSRQPIGDKAIAVIRQHVPNIGEIASCESRNSSGTWTPYQAEALWEAFLARRFDEADQLCALAREALGDGGDARAIHHRINGATTPKRLHRHVLSAADPAVGIQVADILSRHFPRTWTAKMCANVFGRCRSGTECRPCTATLHVEHLAYAGPLSLGGRQVCFALWPSPHKRGCRVKDTRERALALLRQPSVRWPRRAALTAAAYGDIEVLEALAPERATDAPWLPDSPPPAWTIDVVALLAAAGYERHACTMASRYGIDRMTINVTETIAALDRTKPHKPWSRLYSTVLPRCPLPLAALLSLHRADARHTLQEAIHSGVGIPMNAVDAVHMAAAFPGIFDGQQASHALKPTRAVGAIDWLCGQTGMGFDAAYVTSCASIGATAVVYHLVVRRGVVCDVDAIREALPRWVGSYFEPDRDDDDGDDTVCDGDGDETTGPPAWIDFMEPVLRAAVAEPTGAGPADNGGGNLCDP
ncbi:hypothetical protein pqer_cds_593 [Pandoravirus quercus]|uniref:Uncharacterized protein n=1 Tax=Pandoravirus quercus TaxID=2107709 RepID=A0A2U7U9F4_9VIRU|nr:hypothetical protein pqer_cds_593 [Pandoravirus quercus]AVK75015.1 hypothetical protein pqer_cds_593 [Pandoravirus quercus]